MYNILKSQRDQENNIEARLAEIDRGYSVGVWDLGAGEYYPPITIFPYTLDRAIEKAEARFAKIIERETK